MSPGVHNRSPSRLDTLTGMPKRMMTMLRQYSQESRPGVDGDAPCLESLPNELWVQIFSYLEWPGELRTLALVSRTMYDKVLPTLYRTLVVAWSSPERMIAMFALLAREEYLCTCVRTLVFDDDPRRYGRPGRRPEDVRRNFITEDADSTRLRADEKEIDRVRTILYRVLPLFSNLRSVLLCRPHPLFLSTGAWLKPQPLPERTGISKMLGVKRWTSVRRTARTTGAAGTSDDVFHRGSGTDLWAVLFKRRNKDGTRVTRLCAPLTIPRVPQQKSAVAALTHITLHHVRLMPDDQQCLRRWNKVLRCATSLRTLCFVETQSVPHLIAGCRFPHLEDFEAVGLPMRSANRNRQLDRFLRAHAKTLRIIALQLNPVRPTSPFWQGEWLQHPDEFVRLHTLRIEGVPRSRAYTWYGDGFTFSRHTEQAENASAWASVVVFVRACETLTDLALCGLNICDSRALAMHLRATRPSMRRMLLGDELLASFSEKVLPNGIQAIPWKRVIFRFRYALQHWVFYNVLFDGLELSKSGYRPSTRRE
ncbi:hypothetical protein EXIGLDRAFT_728209 [Exidia glandulosa HHB12029]|uniref:F-box domain-containing protein n=1 Tax=Exidia glandulosa HHB12029 TaxID=1314781 RepID=A0A165D0E3_EXIGL|nr:hypothetical protein EXIGLDRAFT_728209 [Exidia glandulosa HHB12029]